MAETESDLDAHLNEPGRWVVTDYPNDGPTPVFVHGPFEIVGADIDVHGPRAAEALKALVALINQATENHP